MNSRQHLLNSCYTLCLLWSSSSSVQAFSITTRRGRSLVQHAHLKRLVSAASLRHTKTKLSAAPSGPASSSSSDDEDDELDRSLVSLELTTAARLLKERSQLSRLEWSKIFDAIEERTAQADAEFAENLRVASADALAEFPVQSAAREEMTQLYQVLKEQQHLNLFGAVDIKSPLAAGSHTLPPPLLEEISGLSLSALTPQPTNTVLLAGVSVAVLEGLASAATNIPLNLLVFCTVAFVVVDRIFANGAVFESFLKALAPGTQQKIIRHEAGHFLAAYVLGCPVEGVVLSAWGALKDRRFGRRPRNQVSAGTSFFDPQLSQQINSSGQVTRSSIDRYSTIVMAGIAAEADAYGRADGGAGDEMALVAFLSQLNRGTRNGYPRGGTTTRVWDSESIRNQARWGALQAVLLLRQYRPAYEALVDALERGGSLGDCIYAIEKAARDHNLKPSIQPLGYILEETNGRTLWSNSTTTTTEIEVSDVPATVAPKWLQSESPSSTRLTPLDEEKSLQALSGIRAQVQDKLRNIEERLKEIETT